MGELSQLPNIGPVIEEQLNAVSIFTREDLVQTGSKEAWLRILAFDPSACYNRLLGLEGAIQGIPKKFLPDDVKEELQRFARQSKGV